MGSVLGTIELVLVAVIAAAAWWSEGRRAIVTAVIDRRIARRDRRALTAAREAAEDDELFAPERVDEAVRRIAGEVPGGTASDWSIRWQLLRVVNRAGAAEDRVIVRVRMRRRRRRRSEPVAPALDQRWTLGVRDGGWALLAAHHDPRATHPLDAPLIADPAADTDRLTEEALRELARRDDPTAAWGRAHGDPAAELLDRSLADARYTPALLEAAIRHIVEVWEVASTGDEAPLRAVATAPAVDGLLHPRQDPYVARLVVRDLRVVRTRVARVEGVRVDVDVDVRGSRALVSRRSGRHVAGAPEAEHTMPLRWTLELREAGPTQWTLTATTDPFTAREPPPRTVGLMGVMTPRSWLAARRRARATRPPHHQ